MTVHALRPPLEDLDSIAERYMTAARSSDPAEAARLRNRMIEAALPFAGRLARRYRAAREPLADLEQVARVGLVTAVDRYEPERGSFTAYAMTTIVGQLKKHFRDHTWSVHVPRRVQELTTEVRRAEAAFTQEHRRPPTDAELARCCDLDAAEFAEARRGEAGYRPSSLARPVGEDGTEMGDLIGATDPALETVPDSVTLSALLDRLPAREREILTRRFTGNQTQAEIAAVLGVSQMHVSRLQARALGWLREAMLGDTVPPWPGEHTDEAPRFTLVAALTGPAALRVTVHGEVDRDNAGDLRQMLLDLVSCHPGMRALRLDLARVPMLDAAGVGVLLAVHEAARARQIAVTATGLQPFVRRIAEISGLSALLD